jgi:hypothetical protein
VFAVGWLPSAATGIQVISYPFLGVRLFHETETSPRPLSIYVAEIDLTAPGISFQVTPRSGSYPGPVINGAPAETARQTTRSFVNAIGAQLGINADFYATEVPATSWANNVGLTASNGDKFSPWDPFANPPQSKQWIDNYFHDALNITQSNVAQFLKMPDTLGDGYQTTPGASLYNTITGQYRILQNGNVKTDYTAGPPDPRTAVGTTANNKLLLVTVDGRKPGFSEGMTEIELANLMKSTYGATNAIVLDGGGSTTMVANYFNDNLGGQVLNIPSDGSERLVGSNLAVFALPNGDYNQNGAMDAGDYTIWRKAIGGQPAYDVWRGQFGNAVGSGSGLLSESVPEPASAAIAAFVCGFVIFRRRRLPSAIGSDTGTFSTGARNVLSRTVRTVRHTFRLFPHWNRLFA